MKDVDLNLLKALDILLQEASVTGATRRLGLSASAMSRTLLRLRESTGDALLVRAGRKLVPTPHALALRERVHALTDEARGVLGPPSTTDFDPTLLDLTFTIRAGGSFVEMLSMAVVDAIAGTAPRVRLCFAPRLDRDPLQLRQGEIDLEIGKHGTAAPEVRSQFLFRDRYVGIARRGHSILTGKVTAKRYAACKHVSAAHELHVARDIRVEVPGYPEAMRIVGCSDLVAIVPRSSLHNSLLEDRAAALNIASFELPVHLPDITISAMWHPRMDADPAHRWLRNTVIEVCQNAYPG